MLRRIAAVLSVSFLVIPCVQAAEVAVCAVDGTLLAWHRAVDPNPFLPNPHVLVRAIPDHPTATKLLGTIPRQPLHLLKCQDTTADGVFDTVIPLDATERAIVEAARQTVEDARVLQQCRERCP